MKKITFILLLTISFISSVNAQEKKFVSGNSLTYIMPQDALGDIYSSGYGIYANFDYNFSKHLVGRFDLGWNTFNGTDVLGVTVENKNVWDFTAGARARISLFYAEFMGGYYTGFNSWGYKPAVGIRWNKLDLQGNINFVNDTKWIGVRLGYYWGN